MSSIDRQKSGGAQFLTALLASVPHPARGVIEPEAMILQISTLCSSQLNYTTKTNHLNTNDILWALEAKLLSFSIAVVIYVVTSNAKVNPDNRAKCSIADDR